MNRIPITAGAFAEWMQSVEDRLRRSRREQPGVQSSFPSLAAGSAVFGRVTTDELRTPSDPATTLGTVVGRVAVYDPNGALVGYLPVYDDIT